MTCISGELLTKNLSTWAVITEELFLIKLLGGHPYSRKKVCYALRLSYSGIRASTDMELIRNS